MNAASSDTPALLPPPPARYIHLIIDGRCDDGLFLKLGEVQRQGMALGEIRNSKMWLASRKNTQQSTVQWGRVLGVWRAAKVL
jgi:hypothetical protein